MARADAVALRDLLAKHLVVEDQQVLPMIERNFSKDEYVDVEQQVRKFMSLRQAFFTVPWWMVTVDPDVAEESRADAPLLLRVPLLRRTVAPPHQRGLAPTTLRSRSPAAARHHGTLEPDFPEL